MGTAKEEVEALLSKLPDDCSIEDIQYHLYVIEKVRIRLAISAQRAEAQETLRKLQERTRREFIDPYYIAIIYLGLGEQGETLAWLNKAYDERSFWLLWLKVEPKFDHLGADPRFADLIRRMGFTP